MKKSTLLLLALFSFGALSAQQIPGRFSLAFKASGGLSKVTEPKYLASQQYNYQQTNGFSLDAGYRLFWKLHLTAGMQYDTRTVYFEPGTSTNTGGIQNHRMNFLTAPLGLQLRQSWWYAGADLHYTSMTDQRMETRPYNSAIIIIDYVIDTFPPSGTIITSSLVLNTFQSYHSWGYSARVGITPPLFGGFRALLEGRYSAEIADPGYGLPGFRGFSGALGLLYNFGKN